MYNLFVSSFIPYTRIGIRSEDIKNVVEKLVKGSGVALSSPRLMIPAAIYALWILSHKFLANDFFDFQVTKNYILILKRWKFELLTIWLKNIVS